MPNRFRSRRPLPEHVDAPNTKLPRGSLLGRAFEAVEPLHDAHASQTHGTEYLDELSLRESTTNSTSPEVDISSDAFG